MQFESLIMKLNVEIALNKLSLYESNKSEIDTETIRLNEERVKCVEEIRTASDNQFKAKLMCALNQIDAQLVFYRQFQLPQ